MKSSLVLFILVITVVLSAPGLSRGESIVVGAFLPLSGTNAVIGHMQKNAMLLAVEEVNRKGVIPGGRIMEIDIRNAGRRPEDTRNIVNHFIRDKQYPIIISGAGSTAAGEAARRCQREFTPLIVITGSADSITRSGYDYVFRIAPPRSHYSDAAIEFVREKVRPDSISLIAERTVFGESIMNVVRDTAADQGWDLVNETTFEPGDVDIAGVNAGLATTNADTVFLVAFPPDAVPIMKEIRTAGFQGQTIVSLIPSSFTESAFLACGEGCDNVFSSALWFEGVVRSADSFGIRYLEKYGMRPDYHAAQAYAAVLAAASALHNVDMADKEAVRDALKKTRIASPLGTVAFPDWDGFTNQNRPVSYLLQWFGDHFEVVWPVRYQTAEPLGQY